MIYIDSWVWIEYGLGGPEDDAALDAIRLARDGGGAISAMGLTEIEYVLTRELGRDDADSLSSAIEEMDALSVVPVTTDVARLAAEIRTKYYERRSRELSYADAIHVATALLLGCSEVHTGDADFDEFEEIHTVLHGR